MTLKVKLIIEPNGDASRAKEISEIEIANVTRDPTRFSQDYLWRIVSKDDCLKPINTEGYIVDSNNDSAIELLWEVLSMWMSGKKYPRDIHGFERKSPEGIKFEAKELWSRLDKIENV